MGIAMLFVSTACRIVDGGNIAHYPAGAPVHSPAMQGQLFTQDFLLRGIGDTPP